MDSTRGAALLPSTWRPWTAESRAAVAFLPGERRAAERLAQRLFGRALLPREYAGLAGAPDNAKVDVGASDGRLYLEIGDPATHAYCGYFYVYGRRAVTVLLNDGLHIRLHAMRRRGFGLQIFYRQVRNATACRVARIDALAGRRRDENGYYTWPRYGFDAPLPAAVRRRLPIGLEDALTLLDLMACPKGREWWRQHGAAVRVRFELADGSRSRRSLAEYLRTRAPRESVIDDGVGQL